MSVQCPLCHSELYENNSQKVNYTCNYCNASLYAPRDINFPCGILLTEKSCDVPRVACPYCGAHYELDYLPHQGLIGCQECLKIFASPMVKTADAAGIPAPAAPRVPPSIPKLSLPPKPAPVSAPVSAPAPAPAMRLKQTPPPLTTPAPAPALQPEPETGASPATACKKSSTGKKIVLWIIAIFLLLTLLGCGAIYILCSVYNWQLQELLDKFTFSM
ncbi:MAG: hypothetical protein IKD22_04650 [Lentisphaeria bacterium]|nr:hypothetical protein [Lentisphaeria bacterium]